MYLLCVSGRQTHCPRSLLVLLIPCLLPCPQNGGFAWCSAIGFGSLLSVLCVSFRARGSRSAVPLQGEQLLRRAWRVGDSVSKRSAGSSVGGRGRPGCSGPSLGRLETTCEINFLGPSRQGGSRSPRAALGKMASGMLVHRICQRDSRDVGGQQQHLPPSASQHGPPGPFASMLLTTLVA
jgi:hypothetical protein